MSTLKHTQTKQATTSSRARLGGADVGARSDAASRHTSPVVVADTAPLSTVCSLTLYN